ncbi:MAG: hypothetical protein HZB46_08790, partial [Solirubrobacterales bacterium]|nr:hypothetical protein [Solirubrobacterales bacterium]
WVSVQRASLRSDGAFVLSVRARSRASTYRVLVNPRDDGRHVSGYSAWRRVAGTRR